MEADEQDAWVGFEDILRAVAMVDVEIDDGDLVDAVDAAAR